MQFTTLKPTEYFLVDFALTGHDRRETGWYELATVEISSFYDGIWSDPVIICENTHQYVAVKLLAEYLSRKRIHRFDVTFECHGGDCNDRDINLNLRGLSQVIIGDIYCANVTLTVPPGIGIIGSHPRYTCPRASITVNGERYTGESLVSAELQQ